MDLPTAGRRVDGDPMSRGLQMLPEASFACQGQKSYGEEVIFEVIIGFHKAIKNISNRTGKKSKVAKCGLR